MAAVAVANAGPRGPGLGRGRALDLGCRHSGATPMNYDLLHWTDAIAGLRVAVLGEAMLDVYLDGAVRRFCPEAPVPVVALAGRTEIPGGAANTAVNVHALGGRVHFLSVTGDDAE